MRKQLLIAVTTILSIVIVSVTYLNRHALTRTNTISVKGMGSIDFTSDFVVWVGTFKTENKSLSDAYNELKNNRDEITNFLIENGISEDEIVFGSVTSVQLKETIYNDKGYEIGEKFIGYELQQNVTIESNNIELIETISRTVTSLLEKGVSFYSKPPRYYYTELQKLKLDLISLATEDARNRAELIAKEAGSSIGKLENANMGVLQILGQYSNEGYSWGGTFNTSSKHKTASITIDLTYRLK